MTVHTLRQHCSPASLFVFVATIRRRGNTHAHARTFITGRSHSQIFVALANRCRFLIYLILFILDVDLSHTLLFSHHRHRSVSPPPTLTILDIDLSEALSPPSCTPSRAGQGSRSTPRSGDSTSRIRSSTTKGPSRHMDTRACCRPAPCPGWFSGRASPWFPSSPCSPCHSHRYGGLGQQGGRRWGGRVETTCTLWSVFRGFFLGKR